MSKKNIVWKYAGLIFLILILAGCTKPNAVKPEIVKQERESQTQEETMEPDSTEETADTSICLYNMADDYATLIYGDGTTETISLQCENADDIASVQEDNGDIYYSTRVYETDGKMQTQIYKISAQDKTCRQIYSDLMGDGIYYSCMDIIDGDVYLLANEYLDEGMLFHQILLQQDGNGDYQQTEEDNSIYNSIYEGGYELLYGTKNGEYDGYYSVPYCMKHFGKVFVRKSGTGEVLIMDEQGAILQSVSLSEQEPQICVCDEDKIIYKSVSEDSWRLVACETENGEEKQITEQTSDINWDILGYENDCLYYSIATSVNLGITKYQVYCINTLTDETVLLNETETVPGMEGYCLPGLSGFNVKDGICYYLNVEDADIVWCKMDTTEASLKEESLQIVSEHMDFTDKGTVTYYAKDTICPECNVLIFRSYVEKFILSDSYANADAINQQLDVYYQERISDESDISPEDHEWHKEEYFIPSSYDRELGSVTEPGSHYLEVNYSDYYYMGGAHGEPALEYYLFDLDTGKEVTFADLYTGSEEEFKTIVAESTRDYYEENSEGFFAATAEEAYEQAYEYASFGMTLNYTESSLEVLFSPYALGPYAVGFITIEIPYEKLGIVL